MAISFKQPNPADIFKSDEEKKCKANGGRWDGLRCIMPPTETPETQTQITTPEIIRDEETGKPSGVKLPDGQTFLGIDQDEINAKVNKYTSERALPEGSVVAGTARIAAEDMRRKIALAKTVGMIDFATASQLDEEGLNVKEYLAAGIQGINIKQAVTAAAAGAYAGGAAAIPTGGLSVAGGAALAGGGSLVLDFFNDVRVNMKDQRKDLVTTKTTKNLKQRKTAMTNYITAANANPADAESFVLSYNIEKSLVLKDYNTLLRESEPNLEFWGSDATPQLVEYKLFIQSVQPSLDIKMDQAVLKPDPTRAYISTGEENL